MKFFIIKWYYYKTELYSHILHTGFKVNIIKKENKNESYFYKSLGYLNILK